MSLISLTGAAKDFGVRSLFSDLDLTVAPGDRLGLIGPNGAGKSTLLRVLAGQEPLDRGERRCSRRTRVILLDQDPRLDPDRTALEEVVTAGGERADLLRRHADRSRALEAAPQDESLLAELSDLHHRMELCDAWGLEQRCREVLDRLGITDPQRCVGELSGGNRRRVALAAALVAEPDVLLLDEPTNHLDAGGVDALEGYLSRFPGALVLVTHDRYLLDRVTRRIVAVEGGRARCYEGNYGTYLARRAEEETAEAAGAARLQGLLRRELAWLQRGPKARSTKQKARLQRIAALQEAPSRQTRGKLNLASTASRLGRKVIAVENLRLRTGPGGRELLRDFSYDFSPEDRVGIIGPNGAGKSTLLEVLAGRRPPDGGTVEIGSTVRMACFDQHSAVLQEGASSQAGGARRRVIDVVREVAERVSVEGSELSASQLLQRFLFPPAQQHQPLEKLSGGERRRLHLCRLLMEAPNVLLLDEPTNDLDVMTLGVLEDFLEDFRGCVVVVSHDRWFLDRCVDRLFCFSDGVLERHEGTYSDYLEACRRTSSRREETAPRPSRPSAGRPPHRPQTQRRRSFRESRELEAIERDLPLWEARREELEQALQNGTVSEHGEMERLTTELAALVERIAAAEDRWLALSELPA